MNPVVYTDIPAIDPALLERAKGFAMADLHEGLGAVAGREGLMAPAMRPLFHGAKVCGQAVTCYNYPGDNLMLHIAVANAQPGVVIVATVGGYLSAGAWGEILTAAAQARGVAGLVIDGAVRDIDAIREAGFPVFSRGLAIGSCTKERRGTLDGAIQFGGATVRTGDLIRGDADGLVVVEREQLDAVHQTAVTRRRRESEIITQLREWMTRGACPRLKLCRLSPILVPPPAPCAMIDRRSSARPASFSFSALET